MSLHWLVDQKIGYFRGPATVGLLKGQSGWVLIDSGVEASVPKKILKTLRQEFEDETLMISAVINTHAHADHCGGNAWLQNNQRAVVVASAGEVPFIEHPNLEPHYLYSASAPKALKGKFFQAEPSIVDVQVNFSGNKAITSKSGETFSMSVDGVPLTFIALPGHSTDMMGVVTAEGYCFCGDLLFTPLILEKHPLLFQHDYKSYLESLEWMAAQSYNGYVLTHGGFFEEVSSLVQSVKARLKANFELVLNAVVTIADETAHLKGTDEFEIHEKLACMLGLEEDFGAWHLNHGVIRSYLSYGLEQSLLKWEKGLYQRL